MRYTIPFLTGAVFLLACMPRPEVVGRSLYGEFCTSCHGLAGEGDGPLALEFDPGPADLTGLSARNGGVFPLAEVISTIDGYTRARRGDLAMPEFGLMLEDGPLVFIDTGDGIPTPTPERLVALAEYLRTIQD